VAHQYPLPFKVKNNERGNNELLTDNFDGTRNSEHTTIYKDNTFTYCVSNHYFTGCFYSPPLLYSAQDYAGGVVQFRDLNAVSQDFCKWPAAVYAFGLATTLSFKGTFWKCKLF